MMIIILLLSYIKSCISYLLVKNVDVEPFTLKLLDGKNGFKYQYRMIPQTTKKLSFYGTAIRLWVEYDNTLNDKGFTLFEFTREYKDEIFSVMDISFVDGFNSNINMLSAKYNISTNFGSNTCNLAGGYYTKGVCLSPCLTWDLDFMCCRNNYGTPQTCNRLGLPISNENRRWREVIRNAVHPPRVYTYAYDDREGIIAHPDETVELQFYRVGLVNTLYN